MLLPNHSSQRGQALALFALSLTVIVLAAAVVVDGGYAFAQRRQAQNAADFAAMAGTRMVGISLTGVPAGAGTAANVEKAINETLEANDAQLIDAQYVDETGIVIGSVVDATSIPNGTFGVVVDARTNWRPFLLGVIGITDWAASSSATAMTPGQSLGGGVLPVGIKYDTFDALVQCPLTTLNDCIEDNITAGSLTISGGFGWLSFGIFGGGGKCPWANSLGMLADGGCQANQPYLDSQLGPPSDSHGCCTEVGLPGSVDLISNLTGNEWGNLDYYVDNRIPVWVPIWDSPVGTGINASYHIVGFGPIIFTGDDEHAKELEGAAVEVNCALPGHQYCAAPGGSFTIDATGEVQLVR